MKRVMLAVFVCMLAGVSVVMAAGSNEVTGKEAVVIRVTNVMPPGNPEIDALAIFAKAVEEGSKGAMKVEIYHSGSMGGEMDNVENVKSNSVTMTMINSAVMANFAKAFHVFNVPYLFPSVAVGIKAVAEPDFRAILDSSCKDAGVRLIGLTFADYRWLTTTRRQVNSVADLRGLKIRTMENKLHIALWNFLGANATPMAGGQVFTALQQGTIEGQENPVSQLLAGKYYEIQKYFHDTRHILNVATWIVNPNWYNSLSADNRAVFDKAASDLIANTNQLGQEATTKAMAELQKTGFVLVPLSDQIRAEFRATVGDNVEKLVRADLGTMAHVVDILKAAVDKHK